MVKGEELRHSPEAPENGKDSLREDISASIDKNLLDKERMVDEMDPLMSRSLEFRSLYMQIMAMRYLEIYFDDGLLRKMLNSKETREEQQEFIDSIRNSLQNFDLTGIESTYGVERNNAGDYSQVEIIQEEELEVNLNEWDANIERYLHELDEIEEEYLGESQQEEAAEAAIVEATQETEREISRSTTTRSPESYVAPVVGAAAASSLAASGQGPLARLSEAFARIGQQFEDVKLRVTQMFENAWSAIIGSEQTISGREYDPTMMESRPVNIDSSLLDSSYNLSAAEVAHLQPQEREYAEIIAAYGGIPPARVEALSEYSSVRNLSRLDLYKYMSEMAEACAVYDIPPDIGLSLMVSNGIIESRLNPSADIDDPSDSHKGLFQFKDSYWEGTFEKIRPQLVERGVIPNSPNFDVMGSIYNSRVQCFAMAESLSDNLGDLGGTWRSYNEQTICRDLYVHHNLGSGHGWMIGYLNGEISTDQLLDMYANRDGNYAILPSGERVIFRDYALRKALELPDNEAERARFLSDVRIPEGFGRTFADQTWNKAQNHFNRVREILYGSYS
jgi:hypothetical protein